MYSIKDLGNFVYTKLVYILKMYLKILDSTAFPMMKQA